MKFAVLHPDRELVPLLDAIRVTGEHQIALGLLTGGEENRYFRRGEQVVPTEGRWEELLHEAFLDGVLFGGAGLGDPPQTEERDTQLRRIVQAGLPMVVSHPACEAILGFELQMIQSDSHGVVVPYFCGLYSPLMDELQRWFQAPEASSLGRIHQISIQRRVPNADRRSMFSAFARDATQLRHWLGRIERMGALRPNISVPVESDGAWEGVSVQMADQENRVVQWTLWKDAGDNAATYAAEMVLSGVKGELRLHAKHQTPNDWFRTKDEPPSPEFELRRVLQLLRDPQQARAVWDHACRGVEIADMIEPSSRRGKTIQLFHEEHSEASTFKSVMAAGGCLAMLAVLALIPFLALADKVFRGFGLRNLARNLPWLVISAALIVFLLAQAMLLLAKQNRPPS